MIWNISNRTSTGKALVDRLSIILIEPVDWIPTRSRVPHQLCVWSHLVQPSLWFHSRRRDSTSGSAALTHKASGKKSRFLPGSVWWVHETATWVPQSVVSTCSFSLVWELAGKADTQEWETLGLGRRDPRIWVSTKPSRRVWCMWSLGDTVITRLISNK